MPPDRLEIRSRFKEFAGEEQFLKFVIQINRFSARRGRLRYWQEDLRNAFHERNPDCRMSHDQLCDAFRICDLHGCEFRTTTVPVIDGCFDYSRELEADMIKRFPHASCKFVSTEGRPMTSTHVDILYCEKCDEVRETTRWRIGH